VLRQGRGSPLPLGDHFAARAEGRLAIVPTPGGWIQPKWFGARFERMRRVRRT
jgi:hypothetical protein